MPFYVSPEQMMQDKAEYARKGIARGKSSVTLEFEGGVILMAENPSSLSKIGEIYDRIAFAGVGKFSDAARVSLADPISQGAFGRPAVALRLGRTGGATGLAWNAGFSRTTGSAMGSRSRGTGMVSRSADSGSGTDSSWNLSSSAASGACGSSFSAGGVSASSRGPRASESSAWATWAISGAAGTPIPTGSRR